MTDRPLSTASPRQDILLLFGTPRLHLGASDEPEPLRWGKPAALLAYLALRPNWHSRESISALFRPDASGASSRAYLRRLIHRIRETYPALAALEVEDERLRWSGLCDVLAFEHSAAAGRLEEALRKHTGPLLQGVRSLGDALDDWFHEERLRVRHRLSSVLVGRIGQRQGTGVDGSDLLQQLVDLDPLDEAPVEYALANARTTQERHVASAAFLRLQRRWASELGQKPSEHLQSLHRSMHAAEAASASPVAAPPAVAEPPALVQEAVPAPLGREHEFMLLQQYLREPSTRMLTLCGLGGIGKTVLARSLFEWHRRAAVQTEVAWIELGSATQRHELLEAMALQLGLRAADGPLEPQLAHWLAARAQITVFLDNMEQLASSADLLEWLMARAPGLRFVITSRERMHLAREQIFYVGGLATDSADCASVALFERHAMRLGLSLDAAAREHALKLVRFLEGFPLAIELAASWLTLLDVPEILAELQTEPGMIDAPVGSLMPSSRSMRSVFHSAWARLDPEERYVLLAISTLQGPITLDVVRLLARDLPLQACTAALLRLVTKSLLRRAEPGVFALHPLLRDFALSNADLQQVAHARAAHGEHFLGLLESAPFGQQGDYDFVRARALRPHAEDFVRAWRWAVEEGQTEARFGAARPLAAFLMVTSRFGEALELCRYTLQRIGPESSVRLTLRALEAVLLHRLGRREDAERCATAVLAEDMDGVAHVTTSLVLSKCWRTGGGDYQRALGHARDALAAAEQSGPIERLEAIDELGQCLWTTGDFNEAAEQLEAGLQLACDYKARLMEARLSLTLGLIRESQGLHAQAEQQVSHARAIFHQLDHSYRVAECDRLLSVIHGGLGHGEQQIVLARSALTRFNEGGYYFERAETLFVLAYAQYRAGLLEQAQATVVEALQASLQSRRMPVTIRCLFAVGLLLVERDREAGVMLMVYAASHQAARGRDRHEMQAMIEKACISVAESTRAHAACAGLSAEMMAQRVLEEARAVIVDVTV